MFKKLRKLRLLHGFTTKDMANKLGISKPFYSQLENENRRLSYEMACKIAGIFNMKPDEIFLENYKSTKNNAKEEIRVDENTKME